VTADGVTHKVFHRWPEDRVGERIAPQFASSTTEGADVICGPSSGLYAANTGEGTQIDTSTEHGKESLAKEAAPQVDLPQLKFLLRCFFIPTMYPRAVC
jgi:hypothetical protein